MPQIFMVRHGETDWNRERRVLGWSEVPINDRGRLQVEELASYLPNFQLDAIYSSPLARTKQSAEILSSRLKVQLVLESRFIEANTGSWEGRLWKDFENDPIKKTYYTNPNTARPPNGETFSEVKSRAVSGVEELQERHANGGFLIVTHADLIRCILCHYLKINIKVVRRFWIDHASLSLITLNQGSTTVNFLNLVVGPSRITGS